MATQERIDQLTQFCHQWEAVVSGAVEQRYQWLMQKGKHRGAPGNAALDELMADLDATARQEQKTLLGMRAYRDLVIAGKAE